MPPPTAGGLNTGCRGQPCSGMNCSACPRRARHATRTDMDNDQHALPSPALASPESGLPALSPRQLTARRANAKKCTGPRSPEGKAVACLNALKHGFFARDVVNPELDGPVRVEEFNSLLDALLEDFQPQSAHERILG